MTDLLFINLGSGSSGNCYLLGTKNFAILLDAGLSLRQIQKKLKVIGFDFSKIYGVLLTHGHVDHVRGANAISKRVHIPIYATKETFSVISSGYRSQYAVDKACERVIKTGIPFSIGEFTIKAFSIPHDVPNVGYQIRFRDKVFVLATDIGKVVDELERVVSDADYLVLEANYDVEMLKNGPYKEILKQRIVGEGGHLSNIESARLVQQNASHKLRRLFLCHLSSHNNTPELALKTFEDVLGTHLAKIETLNRTETQVWVIDTW